MIYSIQKFITRNIKNIPYFFERNPIHIRQNNYALIGKLSASVIHDILTPITSLTLSSNLSGVDTRTIINNSTQQIEEFVDIMRDFLNQSRSIESIHVNKEILKCIKLLTHKALLNNTQIQFIEFDQVFTNIDSLHIYQIIINLLSNAIDASSNQKNRKVILILRKNKKTFQIDCKDFGKGISPELINKIYTPNFTTKKDGCGLGLYSVKYIITNILKGDIYVNSEPDNGSLFSCIIPL